MTPRQLCYTLFTGLAMACLCAAAAPAAAQTTGMDLAKARNCMGCHQVDRKRVGPAFTVIAQRFAGSQGARDYLAGVIRGGSRGSWGPVPMPAQTQVSESEAQQLAAWVLSLAQASDDGAPAATAK